MSNFSTSIHIVLKDLIEAKSKRDKIKFTGYQLASALSMPRSIITKLTHPDSSKRIVNPRIETLIKIVEYFRQDGFDISIDDLLSVNVEPVDIQSFPATPLGQMLTLSLYNLNNANQKIGTIDVSLPQSHKNVMALHSDEDVAPFFKAGSIFVIDVDMKPESDTLVAIRLGLSDQIYIKKLVREQNKLILKSLKDNDKDIIIMPTQTYKIMGVVVQVNAKT